MMRHIYLACVLGLSVAAGCLPQEVVTWSPDGQLALVSGGQNLRLCDAEGKLSEPLLEAMGVWLPSSDRVVLKRMKETATWAEAQPLLSETQQAQVSGQAEAFLRELTAYKGDMEEFQPATTLSPVTLVYLREHAREQLIKRFGQDKFAQLEEMEAGVFQLQLFDVDGLTLTGGAVLVTELDGIGEMRVSPDGKLLAYTAAIPSDLTAQGKATRGLFVLPFEGGRPRMVMRETYGAMDFTPDSRGLVVALAPVEPGNSGPVLGFISRCDLYPNDAPADEFEPEPLAMVVFNEDARVRCLSDGRILFSALGVNLPALPEDTNKPSGLYMLTPGQTPTLTCILTPKERQGATPLADVFAASPDETRVAVIYSEGQVGLLPLDGGPMHMIQEEAFDDDPPMAPTWRSAVELCMLVPPGSPHGSPARAEVVLWSPEAVRTLSQGWPALDFMTQSEPATQPTTQPAE